MPDVIHLANGTTINHEDALDSESNVVASHAQFQSLLQLYMRLWEHKPAVSTLVAAHMGVSLEHIEMAHPSAWKRGSFNLVVPMLVNQSLQKDPGQNSDQNSQNPEQVLLRVPVPAKVGEEHHPGSVADKLRCEAASYIWMQQHCPEVRIPHLYGFSIPGANGGQFVHASRLSIFRRAVLYMRQLVASWLRRPVPSDYLPVALPAMPESLPLPLADNGYMILEYFSEAQFGKQTPFTVPRDRPLHELYTEEPVKTRNLCRGVARTMLALARVPQPRIGAFRFSLADGTIRLDGRPATCSIPMLEAESAPRTIALDTTYSSAGQYVSDLARFHESVFRTGPHMVEARDDAEYQMATMVAMRATAHHFVELGGGTTANGEPFILQLSDSNAGNMLVDDDWNVTAIFDLEWLFAAPVAQLLTPLWLTWQAVNDITSDGYDDYCASRSVFMDVFREEERKQTGTEKTPLSDAMDASWTSQRTWFYFALTSVNGMTHIFRNRLKPLFFSTTPETQKTTAETTVAEAMPLATATTETTTTSRLPREALYRLWQPDAQAVVAQKLRDRKQHEAAVKRLFEDK
ncbi:phosphotransferase enzyme family protein [Ophiostoma piceae UAMH 11346]|uniref:Phosphotransferase enzyme family protein n=1 Tax=Ophiostoma piceae (strain UAMH 11346) TaxID=1262450 RepID=S3CG98_OPHP1|nr:phosphotransferase enzyme family protein [Ophiostoma piceae UAMH 11346]